MKKLLVFKSSSSIFRGCFLASLLLSSSLSASSSNVSSAWTLNEEAIVGEPSKDEVRVDIVFSQWIVGQTKPCGCSLASHGGFEARERELSKIRLVYPGSIVMDFGNALFPDERERKNKEEEESKSKSKKLLSAAEKGLALNQNAKEILEQYKRWKLDAFVLSTLERNTENFEEVKKLLTQKDNFFKVLSLDERVKAFSQPYFDKIVGNTGVRIIPVSDADLKNTNVSSLSKLLHKEFLNIFVGDASSKTIEGLNKLLPGQGTWLYLGSNPDYAMYRPFKVGKVLQQIGAYRGQNWMISSLFLKPSSKSFKYKSEYWFTFVEDKKDSKKKSSKK